MCPPTRRLSFPRTYQNMLMIAATCIVAVSFALPARAQLTPTPPDISGIFGGKDMPHSLTLKELSPDWRRVSIATIGAASGGGMNDLMQSAMAAEMGKSGNGRGKAGEALGAMMGMSMLGGGGLTGDKKDTVYYTKGQVVQLGVETFLVTYHFRRPEFNLMQMVMESEKNGGKDPDFAQIAAGAKLTETSPLTLSLINTKTIASLSDIRPFEMAREIADAARESSFLDLMAVSQKEDKEKEQKEQAEAAATAAVKPAKAPAPKKGRKP